MLELSRVHCGYKGLPPVLRDISLAFPAGEVTVLLGPNGSGKSTLLKTAARLLPPLQGEVLLDRSDAGQMPPRAFARKVAFLPQNRPAPALPAEALVLHGRFPHLGLSRRPGPADKAIAQAALAKTGAAPLRQREVSSLSGGERQKVYLAMALAQDAETILLDEPTTFLDIGRQFELLALLSALAAEGRAVAAALHDLSHALTVGTQIVLLEKGKLCFCGSPAEAVQSGVLERAFGVRIHRDTQGRYYVTPPDS